MKVAIVGSRDFALTNEDDTNEVLIESLVKAMDKEDYVVSGGATGADFWGELFARQYNVGRIIHAAHWQKHGKSAGHIRNQKIVDDADILFSFFTDRKNSVGTTNCVTAAHRKGIPVYEWDARLKKWEHMPPGTRGWMVYDSLDYRATLDYHSARVIESNARPDVGGCADQSHGDLCDGRHDHVGREELSHNATQSSG